MKNNYVKIIFCFTLCSFISACSSMDRLAHVGEEPPLSKIENPTHEPDYARVTMPMPIEERPQSLPSSLWRVGSRGFLKDSRASRVGDIITVVINVKDAAQLSDQSSRSRTSSDSSGIGNLLGLEGKIGKILPGANPASLLNSSGNSSNQGNGSIQRSENISTRMAAVVTQVLPNGNLVISGTQETRINFEIRVLKVAGIIRPQDIDANNEIDYSKIAEARVSYGGRGQISDVQQPRYGSQIMDIILPF